MSLIRGLHGGSTRGPGGGADFAVLVRVLEGLDEAEGFLNITAHGEVTDTDVSHDTLVINDVGGTEGDASIVTVLNEAAVLLGVLHVSEVGVNGGTDNLSANLSESLGSIRVLDDLSGAHKSEVEGPEEQDDILA